MRLTATASYRGLKNHGNEGILHTLQAIINKAEVDMVTKSLIHISLKIIYFFFINLNFKLTKLLCMYMWQDTLCINAHITTLCHCTNRIRIVGGSVRWGMSYFKAPLHNISTDQCCVLADKILQLTSAGCGLPFKPTRTKKEDDIDKSIIELFKFV